MAAARLFTAVAADRRPENPQSLAGDTGLRRPGAVEYPNRTHVLMRLPLYRATGRSGKIMMVVLFINIIDDRRVVDDRMIPAPGQVIPVYISIGNIASGHKNPMAGRNIKVYIDMHARPERSPAIIRGRMTPGYPGGSPYLPGYPYPAVIIIKGPAAIMERRPTPAVTRHPGPSVIRVYPMPVGSIRSEIARHPGHPRIAIPPVVDPPAIRA